MKKRRVVSLALLLVFGAYFISFGSENLVRNPGFDNGLESWSLSHPEYMTHDPEVGRSAKGSLKVDTGPKNRSTIATQNYWEIERGATYEMSVWVKGLKSNNTRVGIKIEYYNGSGRNTLGYNEIDYTRRSEDWIQIKTTLTADLDTVRVALLLRFFSDGPVWFDNVSLIKVKDPDPFMISSKGVPLKPNVENTYDLELMPLKKGNPEKLALKLMDGKKIISEWEVVCPQTREMPDGNIMYTWSAPFPPLKSGEYKLSLKVPELDQEFEDFLDVGVLPEKRKPANQTDDGAFLVKGEPFFPIGLYHVWSETGYPGYPIPLAEDYKLIVEQGFNTVQTKATIDRNLVRSILNTAQQFNLMADVSLYSSGRIKEYLGIYFKMIDINKKHPSVLTWKIMDEPDLREATMTVEVPEAYREYKKLDPATPILLTIAPGPEDKHAFWSHYCDAYQVDPYPLPNKPLVIVANQVALAKKHLEPWQNLTAVLQCGWSPVPSLDNPANQPNKAQARSMVYLSIINGAKGIAWYSYREKGTWNLPDTPLWKDFPEINAETARLGNIVIKGEPFEAIKCVEGETQYASWKYDDKVYVFVTNSGDSSSKIKIDLPEGYALVEQRYDQTSPSITGSTLEDELSAVTSTVYVLK